MNDMNSNNIIDDAPIEQLIAWWEERIEKSQNSTAPRDDVVARALIRNGNAGICFLKKQVESNDIERRGRGLFYLAEAGFYDEDILESLVNAFEDVDLRLKETALIGCVKLNKFVLNRQKVIQELNHDNEFLAVEAMIYLSNAYPSEAVEILREGLQSISPIKRGRACVEAGKMHIFQLKDDVERLLRESDTYVSNMADVALTFFDTDKHLLQDLST